MFEYDKSSEKSLLAYAKKLEGKTVRSVLDNYLEYLSRLSGKDKQELQNKGFYLASPAHINAHSKGKLGNYIETYYFGIKANSEQRPDFEELGIELKTTPIDKTAKNEFRAGERLSLTNISYEEPVIDDFYESHVWDKLHRILLIQYVRDRKLSSPTDYVITHVNLMTPSKKDQEQMKRDYDVIIGKIKAGKAHELSESDTKYLGACTKGATSATMWRPQYYGDHTLAKKRNFCLKQSYMNALLHQVEAGHVYYEPIFKDEVPTDFEGTILTMLDKYKGMTTSEIETSVHALMNNKSKNYLQTLVLRMLGVRSNKAEEFEKANIVVKCLRFDKRGKMKEHISLPQMSFAEVADHEFEDSNCYEYLSSTKFLFAVMQENSNGELVFRGAKFWAVPHQDLMGECQRVYNEARKAIRDGVQWTFTDNGIQNNLPGMANSKVFHVRPHASRSYYRDTDDEVYGSGSPRDGDQLPDGRMMTKQSFWFHHDYLIQQMDIDSILKRF